MEFLNDEAVNVNDKLISSNSCDISAYACYYFTLDFIFRQPFKHAEFINFFIDIGCRKKQLEIDSRSR